jgi:hypothetical protein
MIISLLDLRVRYVLRAPGISDFKDLLRIAVRVKHIALIQAAKFLSNQALFRLLMVLQSATAADMVNQNAVLFDLMTDEDRPMARKGILLRAHEGYSEPMRAFEHAPDPLTECRQLSYPVIRRLSVDITLRLLPSRAEFAAEKHVTNSHRFQTLLQCIFRKVREAAAVGA